MCMKTFQCQLSMSSILRLQWIYSQIYKQGHYSLFLPASWSLIFYHYFTWCSHQVIHCPITAARSSPHLTVTKISMCRTVQLCHQVPGGSRAAIFPISMASTLVDHTCLLPMALTGTSGKASTIPSREVRWKYVVFEIQGNWWLFPFFYSRGHLNLDVDWIPNY